MYSHGKMFKMLQISLHNVMNNEVKNSALQESSERVTVCHKCFYNPST